MRLPTTLVVMMAGTACVHGESGSPALSNCDRSAQIKRELEIINRGERIAATVDEDAWTPEQQQEVEQAFTLWESHDRPVDSHDLMILDRAQEILSSEAVWDRQDDRRCAPDDATFSLFCALQKASIEVLGTYQHRRTALQEVRFAVEEATSGREYEHRLRDFNNDPSTTLDDVNRVINVARERVAARIERQNAACSR